MLLAAAVMYWLALCHFLYLGIIFSCVAVHMILVSYSGFNSGNSLVLTVERCGRFAHSRAQRGYRAVLLYLQSRHLTTRFRTQRRETGKRETCSLHTIPFYRVVSVFAAISKVGLAWEC